MSDPDACIHAAPNDDDGPAVCSNLSYSLPLAKANNAGACGPMNPLPHSLVVGYAGYVQ